MIEEDKYERRLICLSNQASFSYIRLCRVILHCSDIRLMPSDIALRAVKKANILLRRDNITLFSFCSIIFDFLRIEGFAFLCYTD